MDDLLVRRKCLWLGVPAIVCWVMWRVRNAHIFECVAANPFKLPDIALSPFYLWVFYIPLFKDMKYVDWVLGQDDMVFL